MPATWKIEAHRETARLRAALAFLSSRNLLPTYWGTVPFYPPTGADAPWREALEVMEVNPDVPLPE